MIIAVAATNVPEMAATGLRLGAKTDGSDAAGLTERLGKTGHCKIKIQL